MAPGIPQQGTDTLDQARIVPLPEFVVHHPDGPEDLVVLPVCSKEESADAEGCGSQVRFLGWSDSQMASIL
jgi:hypothetical protein